MTDLNRKARIGGASCPQPISLSLSSGAKSYLWAFPCPGPIDAQGNEVQTGQKCRVLLELNKFINGKEQHIGG